MLTARVLLCALLGSLVLPGSVRAQFAASPESLRVTVAQGAELEQVLTLTNTGGEVLSYCLSFERPLEGEAGDRRLSADALGGACGPYGEALALVDTSAITDLSWDPYSLAMTPGGRLFAAEASGFRVQTYELTPELEIVRDFEHPRVSDINNAVTEGVAYVPETGRLWWMNRENESFFAVARVLLLEGDLDGIPTGRRIELPVAESAPAPYETGFPQGLGYAEGRFYWIDFAGDDVWAADTTGQLIDGYPVRPAAYPGAKLAFGLNALAPTTPSSEPARIELYLNPPGPTPPRHLGVIGALGEDTAPGAEPLETPLVEPLPGTEAGDIGGEPVRSTLDPNGVVYYPWSEFQNTGVVAVRAHPLPPAWLVVERWQGALAAGEETEVALTFRPGQRPVGEYRAALQVFEAGGDVVEVPLVLEVTEGTSSAEDGAAPGEASLVVYPNPAARAATVALTLPEAGEATVA
ncbi:MAG: hypothetical protein AAGI91_14700, partial [Bacteroidota bacterium]